MASESTTKCDLWIPHKDIDGDSRIRENFRAIEDWATYFRKHCLPSGSTIILCDTFDGDGDGEVCVSFTNTSTVRAGIVFNTSDTLTSWQIDGHDISSPVADHISTAHDFEPGSHEICFFDTGKSPKVMTLLVILGVGDGSPENCVTFAQEQIFAEFPCVDDRPFEVDDTLITFLDATMPASATEITQLGVEGNPSGGTLTIETFVNGVSQGTNTFTFGSETVSLSIAVSGGDTIHCTAQMSSGESWTTFLASYIILTDDSESNIEGCAV